MTDLDRDALFAELEELAPEQPKRSIYSAREERIIAGFEDIVRFYEEHGRAPQHGEERDIFERLYAVRLDHVRALEECRSLLTQFDKHGLLTAPAGAAETEPEDLDADALAAELAGIEGPSDITTLRHVQPWEERRAAEEIASREKCADFDHFKPLFKQAVSELETGVRVTRPFELKAEIRPGVFFIVGGQIAYVADMGEVHTTAHGRSDARLRVIFDNGTESSMLMRSLQRALNKDEAGRRITEPHAGPLFGSHTEDGDEESGTIYVLRSKSDHPIVEANRELVHKIGVTNLKVEQRVAGARLQPTFLLADVELVASYKLFNINRTRLEGLIHKVFAPAQLDLTIHDRFGNPVKPREWFLVPLGVIDEAVQRIQDGRIVGCRYDPQKGRLISSDE